MNIGIEDRVPYSAFPDRPTLRWPDGKRLAVWFVPNVEHYEFLPDVRPQRDPWPRVPHPDVLSYGVKDYGNRVGLWRLMDVMDRHEVVATASLNVAVLTHYPAIREACEDRGWDYLCHGLYNTRYHWGMSEDEERVEISRSVDLFRSLMGRSMAGWFGPALSQTVHTPDLVAEAGFLYYSDWVHDEQPFPFRTRSGNRLISVPYSTDLNDAVALRQGFEADDFARMSVEYFDRIYEDSGVTGRVMCVAVHPYILGQPHRIAAFERIIAHITQRQDVWITTGEAIARHYLGSVLDDVESSLASGS